jgi:hypothetical protein
MESSWPANELAIVLKSAPAPWTCNPGDPVPVAIIEVGRAAALSVGVEGSDALH